MTIMSITDIVMLPSFRKEKKNYLLPLNPIGHVKLKKFVLSQKRMFKKQVPEHGMHEKGFTSTCFLDLRFQHPRNKGDHIA